MPIRKRLTDKPPTSVLLDPLSHNRYTGLVQKEPHGIKTEECTECLGHGCYNAIENWLGTGKFRVEHCFHCDCDGFREPNACNHRWVEVARFHNGTERVERCTRCRRRRGVDSSG